MSAYKIPRYTCRLVRDGGVERPAVSSFDAAQVIFQKLTADLPFEQVWVLYLDARNKLRGAEMISQGGLHGCAVLPRDVFRGAILASASGIILGHNHPSGDPTPSGSDVTMTRAIVQAGDLLGLAVLDHVIVCPEPGVSTSMRETHTQLFTGAS